MAEHVVLWVGETYFSTSRDDVSTVHNATRVINEYADEGWEVLAVVPGTNGQTWGGLFITLRRVA